jgi:hypothetical protein
MQQQGTTTTTAAAATAGGLRDHAVGCAAASRTLAHQRAPKDTAGVVFFTDSTCLPNDAVDVYSPGPAPRTMDTHINQVNDALSGASTRTMQTYRRDARRDEVHTSLRRTYTRTYTYTYTYTCTYTYTHTHAHTHAHTRTHTHAHTQSQGAYTAAAHSTSANAATWVARNRATRTWRRGAAGTAEALRRPELHCGLAAANGQHLRGTTSDVERGDGGGARTCVRVCRHVCVPARVCACVCVCVSACGSVCLCMRGSTVWYA